MDILTNEVFIGFLSALFGGVFTYLGIANKNKASVAGIYTKEIRDLINDLKEQNEKKDLEISRLEALTDNMKKQLEQALDLVNKLQVEREKTNIDMHRKDKQIETLTKLVNILRLNK